MWFYRVNDPDFRPVFHPVRISFEAEDVGVVKEVIQGRRRDRFVVDDLCPPAERLVGRQDHTSVFIARVYNL
jgi:hypothetical protein